MIPDLKTVGIRNRPIVAIVADMLATLEAAASALPDNAVEDDQLIPSDVAEILLQRLATISRHVRAASEAWPAPPPTVRLPEGFRLPTNLDQVAS
jgi:hypothetical protein